MRKNLLLVAAFIIFSTSFTFLGFLDITLNSIMSLPLEMVSAASNGSIVSFSNIFWSFLFVILQVIGLILIGIYSLKEHSNNKNNLSALCAALSVLPGFVLIDFSLIYLFFTFGFILSCYLVSVYFPRFYEEFKVWRYFRAGFTVTKFSLLIVAMTVAFGVYLHIGSDPVIREEFYNKTVDSLKDAIRMETSANEIPGYENLTDVQKRNLDESLARQNEETEKQLDSAIRQQIENSAFLKTYINNISVITAITVLFALLLLKTIVAPLGGIVSYILLSVLHNRKKHER